MKLFENYPPEQRSLLMFLLIIPLAGIAGIILLLSNSGGIGLGASAYQYAEPVPDEPSFELVGRGFDFVDDYGPAPKTTTTTTNTSTSVTPVTNTNNNASVDTLSAQNVTTNAATIRGRVSGRGAQDSWFVVSRTNSNPACGVSSLQTSSSGIVNAGDQFSKRISLNSDGQKYYYRACAFTGGQTVSGDVMNFTTRTDNTGGNGGGSNNDDPSIEIHFDFVSASCGGMGTILSNYQVKVTPDRLSGPVTIGITSNAGTLTPTNTYNMTDGTTQTIDSVTLNSTFQWNTINVTSTYDGDAIQAQVTQETPNAAALPDCGSIGILRLDYQSSYCHNSVRMDTYRASARTGVPVSAATVTLEKNNQTVFTSGLSNLNTTGWTSIGPVTFNSTVVPTSLAGLSADVVNNSGTNSTLDIAQTPRPTITVLCSAQQQIQEMAPVREVSPTLPAPTDPVAPVGPAVPASEPVIPAGPTTRSPAAPTTTGTQSPTQNEVQ